MSLRSFATAAALFAAVVSASSCTRAEYLEIAPSIVSLKTKGSRGELLVHAKAQNGREFPNIHPAWSIKDPSIATIDENGIVTPLKSGRTEAVASYSGLTASVPVEVLFAEKLTVEPTRVELTRDSDPVELKAHVYDYKGKELKDRSAAYKSLDKKIVTMGQNAVFPGDPGATRIEVRVDEQVQFVDVVVKK